MATFLENAYTIVGQDNSPQASIPELKLSLEKGNDEIKVGQVLDLLTPCSRT
jgi:hypothetical protein